MTSCAISKSGHTQFQSATMVLPEASGMQLRKPCPPRFNCNQLNLGG